jgi:hypothetical protein
MRDVPLRLAAARLSTAFAVHRAAGAQQVAASHDARLFGLLRAP